MTMSSIMARIVALIGGVALQWRKLQGEAPAPAWGNAPVVPEAKPQGALPTLKMPTARGWSDGQKPVAAPGLKVNAFATGLKHPRWINVLPNGDVLIAESNQIAGPPRTVFHYAMQATMRRARALGDSANRITLFRDRDGDGVAEVRETFMEGLNQPFGMALVGDTFMSAIPTAWWRSPTWRAPTASPRRERNSSASSPPGIGRAACCRAPMAETLRRRRLAQQHRRGRHGR